MQKLTCTLVLFAVLFALPGFAQVPQLTPQVRQELLEQKQFKIVRTKADLPESVRTAMADLLRQNTLQLADPGQPRQQSGNANPSLPARRLLYGGIAPDYVFLTYEKYAEQPDRDVNIVLVYALENGQPQIAGGGVTVEDISSFEKLRTVVASDRMRPLARGYLP